MERDIWDIWPGDFIRANDGTGALGIVREVGALHMGTLEIPGYVVESGSGKRDFIEAEVAGVVSYDYEGSIGERRWAALCAQQAAQAA